LELQSGICLEVWIMKKSRYTEEEIAFGWWHG
jgi:hypothetical protein